MPIDKFSDMIGKVVENVRINNDKTIIWFTFADDTACQWHADGDCCSNSWFESVEPFDFKGQILDFDGVDLSSNYQWVQSTKSETDANHELLQYYFVTVKTSRGRLMVEMRNSSNGWYGGDIKIVNGEYVPYQHPGYRKDQPGMIGPHTQLFYWKNIE